MELKLIESYAKEHLSVLLETNGIRNDYKTPPSDFSHDLIQIAMLELVVKDTNSHYPIIITFYSNS